MRLTIGAIISNFSAPTAAWDAPLSISALNSVGISGKLGKIR